MPGALPTEIGVFPLPGALLLPGGRLPLNVFEPRYLALVEDALGAGRVFGMIQPDPRQPAAETGPGLYAVGCLGRIAAFAETGDGRLLITLVGVTRFRGVEERAPRRGYRRLAVDYAPFAGDAAPAPPLADRAALVAAVREFIRGRGIEVNWSALEQTADAELVPILAASLPFDPGERQALLEAPDPAARAETLLALLRFGAHDTGPTTPTRPS